MMSIVKSGISGTNLGLDGPLEKETSGGSSLIEYRGGTAKMEENE